MPDTQQMKTDAMAFYDLMFNQCQPRAAVEQFAGATYRQHNTEVADGKEAFIAYFERMQAEYPGKHVEFKRAEYGWRLIGYQRFPYFDMT